MPIELNPRLHKVEGLESASADGRLRGPSDPMPAVLAPTRRTFRGALAHRNRFDPKVWNWRVHNVGHYIVRALGLVGVASSAELLRHYIHDPELGVAAVDAIG